MLRESLFLLIGILIVVEPASLKGEAWKNGNNDSSLEKEVNLESDNFTVCDTEECRTLAKYIITGMNKSVDPCDDFHGYVCGSWSTNYPIPTGWYAWSLWEMARQKIRNFLREILQEEIKPEDGVPLTMEKKWFAACMDEDRIEEKGLEPLVDIVEKIGGWPIAMGSNMSKNYDLAWQNVAQYYAKIAGGYSLFNIFLYFDPLSNSSVQTLMIDKPRNSLIYKWAFVGHPYKNFHDRENDDFSDVLELPKMISLLYNENEEDDDDYDNFNNFNDNDDNNNSANNNGDANKKKEMAYYIKKIVYDYAEATGEKPKNVSMNIIQLLKFEESLKQIKNLRSKLDYVEMRTMKISEFQEYYYQQQFENTTSKIDWLEMIQVLFEDNGIEIYGSENITVQKISYFHKLAQLLNATPNRVIVNYIHWTFMRDVLKYLDRKTRQWITDKDNSEYGIKSDLERWEHCIKKMPIVEGISYEFVKVHFSDAKRENIANTVEEIRSEINSEIANATWLNEEMRSIQREKLKNLKIKIGYPEWYKEEEIFRSYYYGLKVGPDYFTNFINYLKFIKWKTLEDFRQPLNKEKWPDSPITINALYSLPGNVLFYLAGLSLSPLYSPEAPLALRYGYTGFIIGHEISHAFWYKYFIYDEHGCPQNYLSRREIDKIVSKTFCYLIHYNSYKINGYRTWEENVADGGGLISAFNAYITKIKKENSKDLRLPGLEEHNGNQLFFISFAAPFCQSATPEYLEKNKGDAHSTSRVRINAALSIFKEFSETFNCPATSPLNAKIKCTFWKENANQIFIKTNDN